MAEMLAQAAAVLVPGKVVIGLKDVQANRWLPYGEHEPVALEVRAERDASHSHEVRVTIKTREPRGGRPTGGDDPTVVGVVVFGDRREVGPQAPGFSLAETGPCRFTAEELYADQWLFHGPALQALTRVGLSSPRGIEGTLRVLPRRELFPERLWPTLHTDPIVLDAFTHLLGCWGLDKKAGEDGDVIFPLRLASLTIYGDDPLEGSEIDCRIGVVEVSRHRVKVDATLVGPEGRVWVTIGGWEDWRFYWPGRYRDVLRAPDTVFVGETLELPGRTGDGSMAAVWVEPPPDMAKPVWGDVLEWSLLSPWERARGKVDPVWTWEKIAAKEAARRLLTDRGHPPVYPADLEIQADPDGQVRLHSLREPLRTDLPSVAMAHADGLALAIASVDPDARLGIAVEKLEENGEWETRIQTARKAAGLARQGDLIAADRSTGEITVRLADDRTAVCRTARRGDHVWAWTIFERTES